QGLNPFINAMAFSPDSSLLAVANNDGILKIWDLKQFQLLENTTLPGGSRQTLTSLIFSHDGSQLISGYVAAGCATYDCPWYSQILVWDVKARPTQLLGKMDGAEWTSEALALSPDGSLLASAGHKMNKKPTPDDSSIQLWDTGSLLTTGQGQAGSKGYTT